MLTTTAAKAATPRAAAHKLADAGGLFLFVAPTGLKSWRLKYRFAGREKLLTLGRFPELALAEARAAREGAKAQLRSGVDPAARVDLKGNSFAELARAWHQHQLVRWSPAHAADVLASLERDVFPAIGARPIGAISATELLSVVRVVEARGCTASARRLRQRLSAIFGFAMSQDLCTSDPAAMLGRAMQPARLVRPHQALTTIEDCRALLAACDRLAGAGKAIVLASRFLALTAVRLDAVRGARWAEIEQLGSDQPVWRVPAARMKLARAKKDEARFDHLVPLSAAAIAVLRGARLVSPSAELIFPGRAPAAPIGENALRDLYQRAGFAGCHVPHGWRASFSTILNEFEPEWRSDIDRALAHSPKDKVEAAYNRAVQLTRRRALFERWGELLTGDLRSIQSASGR